MNTRPTAHDCAELLTRLRKREPLVHCITNSVVTGFTANVLLALGASPAMVDIPVEAGMFSRIASGLLLNVGTPHAEQRSAMREAAAAADDADTPWVLDPVAIGALPIRTELARELLQLRPTAIRGNPSEIIALADFGIGGRGTDSTDTPESAADAATHLAQHHGSVVAISGEVDLITDGTDTVRVSNGHPFLTRVTGGGCALGAVTAAFLSVSDDPLIATTTATAVYTLAAEIAAAESDGPGSFAWRFLDGLHTLDANTVAECVQLT